MSSSSNIDDSSNWTWAQMAPELSEREKALRNTFVNEYLVDLDPFAAAIRTGFQTAFAGDYAKKFMGETYVLQRIEYLKHVAVDQAAMDDYDKKRIRAQLMKVAMSPGTPAAAQVAALARLAAILAMDAPIKSESTVTNKGGVMMVPGIAKPGDWEAAAQASQTQLVEDARN